MKFIKLLCLDLEITLRYLHIIHVLRRVLLLTRRSATLVGILKVGKYLLQNLITELGLETIFHAPLLM